MATTRIAQTGPQHPLAAPELYAHPFNAGQVGIPMVCLVGPGVSVRYDGLGRSGFRQGQLVGTSVRAVPTSQWPDSCLRMGIFGYEPSGAGLGLLAYLAN